MAESTPESEEPSKKKQRVTGDDLYRRSTQFEVWSYTPDQLLQTKHRANAKGRQLAQLRFQRQYTLAKQEHQELFASNQDQLNESIVSLLTPEEESTYLDFYIQNITTTCSFFHMPTQVKLTAASFFKKFYLVNSVMEYHPKNILYTCIFLAAKSENYFISIDSFVKALKGVTNADILGLEFILLQSLKFTLLVHHPVRPLYGFFLDFQAELLHPDPVMYDVSVDTIGGVYNRAKEWINKYYMFSDVAFLFAPPHIALAAMYDVDRRITDRYLKRKFLRDEKREDEAVAEAKEATGDDSKEKHEETKDAKEPTEPNEAKETNGEAKKPSSSSPPHQPTGREQYENLVRSIRKCIKLAKDMPVTDRERSKEIDRMCYFALNPKKLIDKRIKKLTADKVE
ncbi:uncharacterized protein LODBEIA_P28290 [Lodderomyces beijingensis]|uniref:Cyclin-like domain-containing protein n=1 Tax=Lodderomyces beijingensis TaxID=1775926 RepID=A0ABP0ZKE1_9ASCO